MTGRSPAGTVATWATPFSSVRVSRRNPVNRTRGRAGEGERERIWRYDHGAETVWEQPNAVLHAACVVRSGRHGHRGTDPTQRWEGQGGPPGDGPDHALPGLCAAVDQWQFRSQYRP